MGAGRTPSQPDVPFLGDVPASLLRHPLPANLPPMTQLAIDPAALRRGPQKVPFTLLGPVEETDLEALHIKGSSTAPTVQKVSARQHRLARYLASGMAPGQAAALCGYSASRVSILQADALFQRIVALYKEQVDELFADQGAKLAEVSHTALDMLMTRLEDQPEDFSTAQLQDLVKLGADRTGFGPSRSEEVNVNHNIGAELDARWQAAQAKREKLLAESAIDGEFEVKDG